MLGVAGGIAAYKACLLLRRLTEAGCDVTVVPTAGALHFVGAATFEALSGRPVHAEAWADVPSVPHVRLGREADLVVVAPATADLLARAVTGRADDLLTATLLTATCPVLLVPAMHTEMWEHPATVDNVATLRRRGVLVHEPAEGRLTGADSGRGRLPEPDDVAEAVLGLLQRTAATGRWDADLTGRRVLVTAGGTREPLDPVRWLGNRASGRQGVALARAAALRGADVTLLAAHLAVPPPAGVRVVDAPTAQELHDRLLEHAPASDVAVLAAAVADFRPASASTTKIKKTDGVPTLELEPTPDGLAALAGLDADRRPLLVGFAAETGDDATDAVTLGREKLARKGCDLLVVNEVGAPGHATGFDGADNAVVVLDRDGGEHPLDLRSKQAVADGVWDLVAARLAARA